MPGRGHCMSLPGKSKSLTRLRKGRRVAWRIAVLPSNGPKPHPGSRYQALSVTTPDVYHQSAPEDPTDPVNPHQHPPGVDMRMYQK